MQYLRRSFFVFISTLTGAFAVGANAGPIKATTTKSAAPEKPVSREYSNYKSLRSLPLALLESRDSIKTHGVEIKWQKIEAEPPCRDIVDKLADWFFPFSFAGIAGEGLISCYTNPRANEKFLFIKLLMEPATVANIAEFNQFLAERERVAIYGVNIKFRQAWGVVSNAVVRAGNIPGNDDPWSITSIIQEDRSTHLFSNYGSWLTHWYDFLTKSGSSITELSEVLEQEFSPGLAEYYKSAIFPQVNGIITQPDATIVYDQSNYSKPDGGVFYVHDCRTSENGKCGEYKKSR